MTRLVTEWSTDDPTVGEALRLIMALPDYSPERHEAEAGLHLLQARWAHRRADQLRATARRVQERPTTRPRPRARCASCRTVVTINQDGTARRHGHVNALSHGDRCPGSGEPPAWT